LYSKFDDDEAIGGAQLRQSIPKTSHPPQNNTNAPKIASQSFHFVKHVEFKGSGSSRRRVQLPQKRCRTPLL
jgi:hypothetical protein